jgi:antitoxin component of MazEF toxin-antitoxin module
MLTKGLSKIGNSLGVIIPKNILDLTAADENTIYQIEVHGEDIMLKKITKDQLREFARKKSKEIIKTQAAVFKKLAE